MPKKDDKMQVLILQEGEDDNKKEPADQAPIDSDNVTDGDETYLDPRFIDPNGNSYFAFNMQGILFWNYYVTYLSLFLHLSIHAIFLGWWCSSSKIVYLYSFQVILLHAYSWAIPDRRYAAWIKEHRSLFYGLSGCAFIWFMMGIFSGTYMYTQSRDGIVQFTGVSVFAYTIMSQGMMMLMLMVNYKTLSTRFAYEKEPYHGKKEWPPPREPLDEHDVQQASNVLV